MGCWLLSWPVGSTSSSNGGGGMHHRVMWHCCHIVVKQGASRWWGSGGRTSIYYRRFKLNRNIPGDMSQVPALALAHPIVVYKRNKTYMGPNVERCVVRAHFVAPPYGVMLSRRR